MDKRFHEGRPEHLHMPWAAVDTKLSSNWL